MAGPRAPTERPLAEQTYRDYNAAFSEGLRANPLIGRLIAFARQHVGRSDLGPDEIGAVTNAIAAAGELLWRTKAGAVIPRETCLALASQAATVEFPTADDGTPLPVVVDVRVPGIPGIDGRNPWVLVGPADVAALREALEPGQVWIRADLLRSGDWARVRALANDAAERMLHKTHPPGRRPGSRNVLREQLLEQIRGRPEMTTEETDALGVELGIWEDAKHDYLMRQRRVRRARKDASI